MNLLNKTAAGIIAFTMVTGIALAGCGTANKTGSNAASTTTNVATSNSSSTSGSSAKTVSVKDGIANLLTMAKELKTVISSGDEAKVKENGPKLEDTWSSFEDNIKPKYPDLYDKVEQYLDPTVAGSKASPLDKQALLKLDEGLIQALTELSQKVQ